MLTTLALAVLLAVLGFDWVAARTGTTGLPWRLPDLLPASVRDQPRSGFEEAGDRLSPPVEVATPHGSYRFQYTQGGGTGGGADAGGADGAEPVAWSPCRPVHVVVDPTGAPPTLHADVQVALGEVAAATGLVFADDGLTAEPASVDRESFQPSRYGDRWAPVLVAFADEAAVPALAGTLGIAQVQPVTDRWAGREFLVSGTVYLHTDLLAPGRAPADYQAVLRHELAHVVGLDHVDDPTQLMYPVAGVTTFQAGDLTGLAALGDGACAPGV